LEEHFAAGWQNWVGGTDDWKVDVAGVRTGSLALYSPSLALSDYDFEFLARLESHSVTWVFRAANFSDYYQATIAVAAAGGYEFRRHAVLGGVPETPFARTLSDLPSGPAGRTAITVKTQIAGSQFRVFLDGQVVDTWNDSRLLIGGIGFTGAADDRARLYWVRLSSGPLSKEHWKQ
jgi:hypothetical protein